MSQRQTTLERAFDLARSGACVGLQDIRMRLKSEGYDPHQIEGPMLVRQLRELCDASRRARDDEPPAEV